MRLDAANERVGQGAGATAADAEADATGGDGGANTVTVTPTATTSYWVRVSNSCGQVAWQTVFHFHLHLVPRNEGDHLVPPWPLDQSRAEGATLRALANAIRSAREDDPGCS